MPMTIASTSGDTRARAVTRGGETVYLRDIDPVAAKLSPLAAFIAAHARIAEDRPSHEEQGRAFRCFHGEAQAARLRQAPDADCFGEKSESITGAYAAGTAPAVAEEWVFAAIKPGQSDEEYLNGEAEKMLAAGVSRVTLGNAVWTR